MRSLLHKLSTSLIISGVLSLVFGILSFTWPGITLVTLIWLFAIFFIAQGIAMVMGAIVHRNDESHWLLMLFVGAINILAGLFAIFYPGITAFFLVGLMGATWFLTGILQIIAAIRLRKEIENEGWLILSAVLSVVAGLYVIFRPGAGAVAIIWLIALYAVVFGILIIMLGVNARKWGDRLKTREMRVT
jgi:uncharacterized membrane protein HdeD (DUF308 family)